MGTFADTPWDRNEHGLWCQCCGYLIATPEQADSDDFRAPDSCGQCGYPDSDSVAAYHGFGDDADEPDDDTDDFDCPRFWTGGGWFCPMAGTEDCDWECPN